MSFVLHTPRLILSPFTAEDQTRLHHLFTDPFIRKYLWDDQILSRADTQGVLAENQRHFEEDKWGLWKILLTKKGEIIGFAGLWTFFEEPQPQLIYGLLETYTGKGYAYEAGRAVIKYAFDVLQFEYLTASMDKPHVASQKVAQRLQMTFFKEEIFAGKATVFYQCKDPAKDTFD